MNPGPSWKSYGRLALQCAERDERIDDLELALDAALRVLGKYEPGDSRAVSDEFVSMAAILTGCPNDEARDILLELVARDDSTIAASEAGTVQ